MKKKTSACLLFHDAPCTKSCAMGMDPARILRSLQFDNDAGALLRLKAATHCAECGGECDAGCILPDKTFSIREVFSQMNTCALPESCDTLPKPDLSCDFLGVHLENPFLLSSSVVASTYEKMARAFEMGWAGACFKTICDFIPHEASPRYSALQDNNSFYGFKNIEQLSCNTLEEDLEIIRRLKKNYPTKMIIGSIMGRNEAEWEYLARVVQEAGADVIECNFSCHNMEEGGLGVENVTALDQLERDTVLLPKFLRDSCIGCGRCFLSCLDGGHEAITMRSGKPMMNPRKCVGCHLCILVCPQKAIRSSGRRI